MAKKKTASESPPHQADASAGYTVLARRYRPLGFADLVGQEPVAQALTNALQSGRVAHAYVFTGARGVGKTSTARILAKALNCVRGPTPTPCNECDPCRAIAAGDDIDVLEIDGASNNGVEEVREIRNNVQFRPSRCRFKIYIIDEVHMLSKGAFNALLKTLEEPPPHVKFILATTEIEKIPVTILSRCQRFDFAGIGTTRIVQRLKEIVAGEGMKADDEAIEMIARRAGGSMRDAQSLLDQLLAFGADQLTAQQVHQLLGTASDERIADLAGAVLNRDAQRMLELVEHAADEGLQLGELLDQLISYWRDLMVVRAAGAGAPGLSVSSQQRAVLLEQAQNRSLETITAGLDILAAARARMRSTQHGRILLEMAVLRVGRLDDLKSLTQLAEAVARGTVPQVSASALPAPDAAPSKKNEMRASESFAAVAPAACLPLTTETLPGIWSRILPELGSLLRFQLEQATIPAISGPNNLVLRVGSGYNPCADPETVSRIEALLQQFTGQKCQFRIETAGSPATAGPASDAVNGLNNANPRSALARDEADEPPLVKWAEEILGAKVLRKDPGFGASAPALPERADVDDRT
jgi:DNA polymerase III subunit gamma/tau